MTYRLPKCLFRFFPMVMATVLCPNAQLYLMAQIGDHRSHAEEVQPTQQQSEVAVFRAQTRTVLVDVVVNDQLGHYVLGLSAADFTILEDGKPQLISGFAAQKPGPTIAVGSTALKSTASLPPNVYTNFTPVQSNRSGAVTVIVLDLLNTTGLDRAIMRQQMLKFLKDIPPGQQVALFTLSNRLRMIADFTSDSTKLIAAANAAEKGRGTVEVTSDEDRQQVNFEAFADDKRPAPQKLLDAFAEQESYERGYRAEVTLDILSDLARSLTGYAGRKNVLWLAAEFPVQIGPEFTANIANQGSRGYAQRVEQTEALLAQASVALYPIHVRGQEAGGISISTPDGFTGQVEQDSSGISGGTINPRATGVDSKIVGTTSHVQFTNRSEVQSTMEELARETGGRAFFGTNDLSEALRKSLDEGSHYYTIAYTPQNSNWNGGYRKIEVKIRRSGMTANNRHGYFAVNEAEVPKDQAAKLLASASQPAVPISTMLVISAQVLPPDATHKAIRIDYLVDVGQLTAAETPDHKKQINLSFLATAWDENGKDAGHLSDSVDGELKLETYQSLVKSGLRMHQDLELKPGEYRLRLAVIDRGSQRVGTLDVPLKLAAAK